MCSLDRHKNLEIGQQLMCSGVIFPKDSSDKRLRERSKSLRESRKICKRPFRRLDRSFQMDLCETHLVLEATRYITWELRPNNTIQPSLITISIQKSPTTYWAWDYPEVLSSNYSYNSFEDYYERSSWKLTKYFQSLFEISVNFVKQIETFWVQKRSLV